MIYSELTLFLQHQGIYSPNYFFVLDPFRYQTIAFRSATSNYPLEYMIDQHQLVESRNDAIGLLGVGMAKGHEALVDDVDANVRPEACSEGMAVTCTTTFTQW